MELGANLYKIERAVFMRFRRYTSKKLAKALMRRKLGSEISARNRGRRAKQRMEANQLKNDGVLISNVWFKNDVQPIDPYATERKAIHGTSLTMMVNRDGSGVICPACKSDMGRPQQRGLFQKYIEYKCPKCHLVAKVKSVRDVQT